MFNRLSRAAHRGGSDAGFGMILVIGLAAFMTILIGVLVNIVVNSLDGSSRHNNFDAALASAEAGIDQTLARLSKAYIDDGGVAYYTPNQGIAAVDTSPVCAGAPIASYTGTFSSVAEERTWARKVIAEAIAENPACIQHTANGDFVAVKTQDTAPDSVQQVVYSEGWAPGYGVSGARTRLVKAEYLFQPYAPSNAILTNGNLTVEHSTTVTTVDPTQSGLADIHSNGNLTLDGCSYSISGQVSTTGSVSGTGTDCTNGGTLGGDGTVDTTPTQNVDVGTAYELYSQTKPATNYPTTWYDMCGGTVPGQIGSGGWVLLPSSSGPCTGSVWSGQPTIPGSNPVQYRPLASGEASALGFEYDGTTNGLSSWNAVGVGNDGVASGTYYFNDANVGIGNGLGNKPTAALTLIASALNDEDFDSSICQKQGGNITWNKDDPQAPALAGDNGKLFMFADADLTTGSNFSAGSSTNTGFFIAGDQVHMTTSSNGAYGSVIAGDQCPATSSADEDYVDNPSITYDPNGTAPFTSIIDTTLWLEFVGS